MNPNSRIVLIVPSFPKLSETFIVRQALGLRRRGLDVHVLCRRFDRAAFDVLDGRELLEGRIHLEPPTSPRWRVAAAAPGAALRWLRRPIAASPRTLYLESTLRRLCPPSLDTVVHFEFGSLAPDRIGAIKKLAAKRPGLKVVVSFRGFDINYVGLDRPGFYDPVWRDADALHFLGEDLYRRAVRRGCAPDKPYALIAPAVDTARFAEIPSNQDAPDQNSALRLLSIGRLEWKKGHDYALRALGLLRQRGVDARLRVLGGGDMLGALCFMRHQLGLDDVVDFPGAVPHGQIQRELAEADVLVHLSTSEGFGNAVLEAQAMARPVVASDADGLPENVIDGETGLIVPRRDPEAAADALERLAVDAEWRRSLGEAGRRRVRQEFTLEREIDGFERLYAIARGLDEPGLGEPGLETPDLAASRPSRVRSA